MSHIHIPDGVLPAWLVLAGWLIVGTILFLVSRYTDLQQLRRRLPLVGVVSALMLVAFSLAIVPIGYHMNLSVVAGIVLGPALGFVAAFVVNVVLALFGHGGITVVGLNTLVTGVEIGLGYYLFRFFRLVLGRWQATGAAAALATVLALFTSTWLMIGIVALSNVSPAWQIPEAGALERETLSFRDPLSGGIISIEIFGGREEAPPLDILNFARLVMLLGLPGWLLEAVVTALVVGYVLRLRPDLLAPEPARRTV